MSSWKEIKDRQKAVETFVKYLQKSENKAERDRCRTDHPFAKDLFARLGGFEVEQDSETDDTKIPKQMEFRIYEENDPTQRDKDLGIMVLPAKPQDEVDVSRVWLCTWADWTSLTLRTRA